jgi:hypothetical protein
MITDYSQVLDLLWSELRDMIYTNTVDEIIEIDDTAPLSNYTDLIMNLEKLKFKVKELKDIRKCL